MKKAVMNERERYLKDWKFRALVDTLVNAVEEVCFSMQDIVSAMKLADKILQERKLEKLRRKEEYEEKIK